MNKISYSCLRLKQLFHVSLHEAMCNRLPGTADRAVKDGEITAGTNWDRGRLDSLRLFIYLFLYLCVCAGRGGKFPSACGIFKGKRAVAALPVSLAGLIYLSPPSRSIPQLYQLVNTPSVPALSSPPCDTTGTATLVPTPAGMGHGQR